MADQSKIAANLRQMMLHQAQPMPRALAPTAVTRGFEAVAYPKIVRELADHQLLVRQKALLAARELLSSPTGHVQCVAAGISPATISLLQDPDALVRERAAGTLEYIMGKELGARDVIQHNGISRLVVCLSDTEAAVRTAAYLTLIEAARFNCVRGELCTQKALVHLMKLALQEEQTYLLKALLVLNACVQMRHNEDALTQLIDDADAIPSLSTLLSEQQPSEVQEQVAQLLGLLTSRFSDARIQAVKVDAVPKLVALLLSRSVMVASAAATALMSITISREGKYAVIQGPQGVAPLVALLKPHHVQLCINVMEIITNVSEAPEARPMFAECGVDKALMAIHQLLDAKEQLKASAAQALRQCGFKHLPYAVLPGRQIVFDEAGRAHSTPSRAEIATAH